MWNTERGRALTSLVFPTYNPGPSLERTWYEVDQFIREAPGNWEVLFVCDGCTDGTPALLDQLLRGQEEYVRVLSYSPNRGKGHAVRRGMEAASGAWRIFTDVDLSYGLDGVLRVAEKLWAGADACIGSRMHADSLMVMPAWLQGYAYRRFVQGRVFSLLTRLLLPLGQQDTQSGLKGFSARAVQMIFPHLRCDGFAFDCEMLLACQRLGMAISEVPVSFRFKDANSTTNLRAMFRMVGELWKMRRAWREMATMEPAPIAPADRREAA